MEGGRKSERVSNGSKRKPRLTISADGVASMGVDFNALNFFIVEQQKSGTFTPLKIDSGACCLTILIYTFKMFKGVMRPRHAYICGF